ncbi:iron chelate uptake ABC transporter family permease subunit, partial [Campylobacter sp. MIT 21-1685]|uniref:iron chelate uptake ABC transporter family permease subunit n=1 Tax=unclassified Campylobacter TaxID=2593542 RepID=UPI00224B5319
MKYFGFFCLLVVALLFSLTLGRYEISLEEIVSLFLVKFKLKAQLYDTTMSEFILFENRFPRALLSVFVGAALGVSGASFQALFKNALASPDILGVTSGCAFGAVLALLLGVNLYFISFSSFVFGILSLMLTLFIARGVKNHIMVML